MQRYEDTAVSVRASHDTGDADAAVNKGWRSRDGVRPDRSSSDGETRYLALYCDVKGRQRSAGTFATPEQAMRAWQKAEDKISEGRLGDARRGRQKFARYVEEQWLPHHQMEARTRENYTYYLGEHILPVFGTMRLIEILPVDVGSGSRT